MPEPAIMSRAGKRILPIPLKAALNVPDSQINIAPVKNILMYSKDSSNNKPSPPRAMSKFSPPIINIKKKSRYPQQDNSNECHNNFSALSLSSAPKLLAIEEVTAPPRAPKAIC